MASPTVNIVIDKGTYFENTFFVNNDDGSTYDLIGYTASSKIRKHPTSTNSQSFSVFIVSSQGKITLSMSSSITSQLTEGRNYYDILLIDPYGDRTKVIEGTAIVNPSVSV